MSKHTPIPWFLDEEITSITGLHNHNEKMEEIKVCDIRGWGALTGACALNMSSEEAFKVQKANAEHIVKCVNEHESLKGKVEELVKESQFLLERLYSFGNYEMSEDQHREYHGHVSPSVSRLRGLVEKHNKEGC